MSALKMKAGMKQLKWNENLTFEMKSNERLYLWQYKIGLGQEPVLFCRDIKIDDEPNPPTEVPLPPAK